MTLALDFGNSYLLIGLLAAAIPLVLHLLSSIKAQEVLFPTLRFLKSSMERTARRRRIQHWLLLLLRAALLGFLAMAVSEPISKASQGWLGGQSFAAVVILDNSYSMLARSESTTRFEQARSEAKMLLGGDRQNYNPPGMAALLTTNGPQTANELTANIDEVLGGGGQGGDQLQPCADRAVRAEGHRHPPGRQVHAAEIHLPLQRHAADQLRRNPPGPSRSPPARTSTCLSSTPPTARSTTWGSPTSRSPAREWWTSSSSSR